MKRMMDLFLSLFFILLTLPLQLIIASIIIAQLREYPIFKQRRSVTLDGGMFLMYKFRTIFTTRNKSLLHHSSNEIFVQSEFVDGLTKFTTWLRKTGLDELPQLYNVLKGEMSLVGPRPLMLKDLESLKKEFPEDYESLKLISSKPGLTGPWQLIGDRELGVKNFVGLSVYYFCESSILLDMKIILFTIPIVLFAKNSDAILSDTYHNNNTFLSSSKKIILKIESNHDQNSQRTYHLNVPTNWSVLRKDRCVRVNNEATVYLMEDNLMS